MAARSPSLPPRRSEGSSRRRRRAIITGAAGSAGLAAVALAIGPDAQASPAPVPPTTDVHAAAKPAAAAVTATNNAIAPNYGVQKVRVGVQVKSGAWVPDGTTTAGTELTLVETNNVGTTVNTETCTTDASTAVAGSTATYCILGDTLDEQAAMAQARVTPDLHSGPTPTDAPNDELYFLDSGDTLKITQTTVEPNLLTDPATATVSPCITDPNGNGFCTDVNSDYLSTDEIFDDPGLPPKAVDDSASVVNPATVKVNVLSNDTTHGAPASISIVSGPSHGTAVVDTPIGADPKAEIAYTPSGTFTGVDHLRYRLTTPNGSSIATVTITVTAPLPVAVNDSATTPEGVAVSIPVTANDSAPAGETLHLSAVGSPKHGTVSIHGTNIEYTPAAGFTGTDSFPYTDTAVFGSASAIVTVTVTPVATVTPSSSTSPLANTGVQTGQLTDLGGLLLAAGMGATVIGRRRRGRHAD